MVIIITFRFTLWPCLLLAKRSLILRITLACLMSRLRVSFAHEGKVKEGLGAQSWYGIQAIHIPSQTLECVRGTTRSGVGIRERVQKQRLMRLMAVAYVDKLNGERDELAVCDERLPELSPQKTTF